MTGSKLPTIGRKTAYIVYALIEADSLVRCRLPIIAAKDRNDRFRVCHAARNKHV